MEQIRQTDLMYTAVKNIGQCMGDGAQGVWDEHAALRERWLREFGHGPAAKPTLSTQDHLALALSIQARLEAAGLLTRDSGAN